MAMSMKEKASNSHVNVEWTPALKDEFAREAARETDQPMFGHRTVDAMFRARQRLHAA